jgi:branched-chain amino acid transport system ATP-binding protein
LDRATADNTIALAADNIRLAFGRIHVLDDVSFDIKQDEILSIIGPNGAGKTSLMNCP